MKSFFVNENFFMFISAMKTAYPMHLLSPKKARFLCPFLFNSEKKRTKENAVQEGEGFEIKMQQVAFLRTQHPLPLEDPPHLSASADGQSNQETLYILKNERSLKPFIFVCG